MSNNGAALSGVRIAKALIKSRTLGVASLHFGRNTTMALARERKIGFVMVGISVLALGAVVGVTVYQRAQLATQQQLLEQTRSEVAKAQSSLDAAAVVSQQQTQALEDAVKNSEQYQQELHAQSLHARRIANGLTTANVVKTEMAECYMTTMRWPNSNADCGISSPTSFANANGLRSITVMPNGKIKIEFVDDENKKALLWLTGSINGAMQVNWACTTKDIADISKLIPTCRFNAD